MLSHIQIKTLGQYDCILNLLSAKSSRVLNGSKIREPNRTEPKTEPNRTETEPMKKPKFYLQIILTVKIVVNDYYFFRFSVRFKDFRNVLRN